MNLRIKWLNSVTGRRRTRSGRFLCEAGIDIRTSVTAPNTVVLSIYDLAKRTVFPFWRVGRKEITLVQSEIHPVNEGLSFSNDFKSSHHFGYFSLISITVFRTNDFILLDSRGDSFSCPFNLHDTLKTIGTCKLSVERMRQEVR
jgi:hypothetical protein